MSLGSRRTDTCGPDCRYRRLYEGSQESLNDMAGKHAAALGRVAQLRSGLLSSLKQSFAAEYAAAERQLGHQLAAEKQDSVVLAFTDAFLRSARSVSAAVPPPYPGVDQLRAALARMGVNVTGTDLTQWAAAVDMHRSGAQPTPAGPAPAAGGSTTTTPADLDIPWSEPAPEEQGPSGDLDDLFGPVPDDERAPAPSWDLTHLFDDPGAQAPADADPTDDPEALLESLYGKAEAAPASTQETEPAQRPLDTAPQAAAPAPSSGGDPAPYEEPPTSPRPEVTSARTAATVLKPEMFPAASLPRAPKVKRTPRTPRVSAAAPQAEQPGSPAADTPSGVATERFAELLEMVSRPKPVFLSDMVAATGSPGLVAAWEAHVADLGGNSPVRVITPRAHHRDRGGLVVPHAQDLREALDAHETGWWAQCLDDGPERARLRGARLYETAVVLHRFADEIVSFKLGQHVLSLRLNTPAGLTGVVLWVGSDSPAGEGRSDLTAAVGEMVGERLVLLAVLTPEGGGRAVDRLAGLVAEDAAAQGWAPTMPLVASHSWEFASNGGASALAIL